MNALDEEALAVMREVQDEIDAKAAETREEQAQSLALLHVASQFVDVRGAAEIEAGDRLSAAIDAAVSARAALLRACATAEDAARLCAVLAGKVPTW